MGTVQVHVATTQGGVPTYPYIRLHVCRFVDLVETRRAIPLPRLRMWVALISRAPPDEGLSQIGEDVADVHTMAVRPSREVSHPPDAPTYAIEVGTRLS